MLSLSILGYLQIFSIRGMGLPNRRSGQSQSSNLVAYLFHLDELFHTTYILEFISIKVDGNTFNDKQTEVSRAIDVEIT